MSNARAIKLGAAGAVLVGGAMWFSPPQPVVDWLSPEVYVATKEPAGRETGTEAPAEVTAAINPLSQLTADQLKETLDRPLFNPARAGRPEQPEPEPEPQVTEVQPPADDGVNAADLSLLGVAGSQDNLVAMVKWTKTNKVYRLKRGQFLSSLELVKVDLREATLRKDDKVIVLALFAKGASAGDGVESALDSSEDDAVEEADGMAGDTGDEVDPDSEADAADEVDAADEEVTEGAEGAGGGADATTSQNGAATGGETYANEADEEE